MAYNNDNVTETTEGILYVEVEDPICSNSVCKNDFESLNEELRACRHQIECARLKYHESLVLNLKKDITIRELKQKGRKTRFNGFNNDLSVDAIAVLNSIDNIPGKDLTFILQFMKFVYKDGLSRLKNKTYSGRTKEALTPSKVELMKKVYTKRMTDQENATQRMADFGKHNKMSIASINKTNK